MNCTLSLRKSLILISPFRPFSRAISASFPQRFQQVGLVSADAWGRGASVQIPLSRPTAASPTRASTFIAQAFVLSPAFSLLFASFAAVVCHPIRSGSWNMKSFARCFVMIAAAGVLAGCAPREAKIEARPQRIGMANPASEHCISKGGKLEIRKNKDGGEFGVCHLPDGSQVEEWELFHRDTPKPAS